MTLIARFFRHDAAGGVLLMIAAVLALLTANSALSGSYQAVLALPFSVTLGGEGLTKPLILWINDGLMAVFFFLIGLELKRELVDGKLRNPRDVLLPGLAAVGGMVVPALLYWWVNRDNPIAVQGWAIPAATDIAFAVGVLALLGSRVPASLKIFLLTLAILDDMGAILIIALFYTADLNTSYLLWALLPIAGMVGLNRAGVGRIAPYVLMATVLWVLVLKSGVHATLAGVIAGMLIPLRDRSGAETLHGLEHALAPYVMFLIVPIFAFANAGVSLAGLGWEALAQPVPLGIILGLVIGKDIGVLGAVALTVKAGWAKLPAGAGWLHVWGVACLAGIGFTMSLFIGTLSFSSEALMNEVRAGVLAASAISMVMGYVILWLAGPEVYDEPGEQLEAAEAALEVEDNPLFH